MTRVKESTSAHTNSANSVGHLRTGELPRTTGAPVVIVHSNLNECNSEVRAALAGTAGQQRKSRVDDNFGGFVQARTNNERGWKRRATIRVVFLSTMFSE